MMHAYGVNNISFVASIGNVVVFDDKNGYRIGQFKQGNNSNVDFGLALTGYAGGYKMARGTNAATATATIATGLSSIVSFAFGIQSKRATTANYCNYVTGKTSTGTLYIWKWKHKSATNSTVVATTNCATIDWTAIGT